jgi:hypothetical protein
MSTFSGKESIVLGGETTFSGIKSTSLGLNLKKSAFLVIWSSFGVPSVVSRSSLGKTRQGIREVKELAILIKSTFLLKSNDRFGITRHGVWSFVQFFQKNANSSLRESCTSYQKAVPLRRFRKQSIYEATQITNWRVLSPLWSDHKDTATL